MTEAKRDNIVLIGMPAAGKSTIGVVLAKIMNLNFLDTDLVIQQENNKTLEQLLDSLGREGFIDVENKVLSDIQADRSVLATGGSAVYSKAAMEHLKAIGSIVYLRISYEALLERLEDLHERGVVLGEGMTLQDLYKERQPLYEQYAEITVDVDGLTITEAARKTVAAVKAYRHRQ